MSEIKELEFKCRMWESTMQFKISPEINDLLSGKATEYNQKFINSVLNDIPFNERLTQFLKPNEFSNQEVKNFVNFAKSLNNANFMILLQTLPHTLSRFSKACHDDADAELINAIYYENTFAHNLFSYKTTDDSGVSIEFSKYIQNRLSEMTDQELSAFAFN